MFNCENHFSLIKNSFLNDSLYLYSSSTKAFIYGRYRNTLKKYFLILFLFFFFFFLKKILKKNILKKKFI